MLKNPLSRILSQIRSLGEGSLETAPVQPSFDYSTIYYSQEAWEEMMDWDCDQEKWERLTV